MKFVIYNGQKKITIDNAWLPQSENFTQLLTDLQKEGFRMQDLQLYDVRITATRGMNFELEEIEDVEIEREINEGINWRQVTIN